MLGVLSLVFWSLLSVIVLKYLTFIMKADNDGAGGILALLALVQGKTKNTGILLTMALFGTALLYGDGVITPAISVLSAIEGLEVATVRLKPAVLPLTALVLVGLFLVQRRGTAGIGKVFGPVTLVWFATISVLGLRQIVKNPHVLAAVDPRHGILFFVHNGGHGFLVLGSVFLVVTGGEALYADMGHFGRAPIRFGWFTIVFPSLLLNYFGQGALLLTDPKAASNPFYALVPQPLLYPVVVIAAFATVVASQALISGVFSLTQQAVQLGLFPRVTIIHTSSETEGQIYIPEINFGLLVACIACVFLFKSSTALAAAYGIAVTGTMGITTVVYYFVVTRVWGWSNVKALPLIALFLVFDLAFFGANAAKFFDGGWFPLLMAVCVFYVMTTWKLGRRALADAIRAGLLPLDLFFEDVVRMKPSRVPGTAVFMTSNPTGAPPVLLHHFKHNKVLHTTVVLLTVENLTVPEVAPEDRITVKHLTEGFHHVTVRYGFSERPDVPAALLQCKDQGLPIDLGDTSYYLGRESPGCAGRGWRAGASRSSPSSATTPGPPRRSSTSPPTASSSSAPRSSCRRALPRPARSRPGAGIIAPRLHGGKDDAHCAGEGTGRRDPRARDAHLRRAPGPDLRRRGARGGGSRVPDLRPADRRRGGRARRLRRLRSRSRRPAVQLHHRAAAGPAPRRAPAPGAAAHLPGGRRARRVARELVVRAPGDRCHRGGGRRREPAAARRRARARCRPGGESPAWCSTATAASSPPERSPTATTSTACRPRRGT